MNPTQILNMQEFEYIRKLEKLFRVSLGRNCARPSCTVALGPRSRHRLSPRAQHVRDPWPHGRTTHVHVGAARVRSARPALTGPASVCAARDSAAQSGARRSGHRSRAHVAARPAATPQRWRRRKRRRSSTHDGEASRRTWGRGK
jgi:hypothetical protein